MSERKRVAYVIGFSAPPVLHLTAFLQVLHDRAWDTYVILSPAAASWVDLNGLADASGHPVRVAPRRPEDPDLLPPADAVVAAPLTFNSLNKWALGISDTLALGLLNEALGLDVYVMAALCIKDSLRHHPAFVEHIQALQDAGVTFLDAPGIVLRPDEQTVTMNWSLLAPPN